MSSSRAEVVICGAGIAGISAAYHLAVKRGVGRVLLVDERPPLSLTSDKSTECYRNWWPGPGDAMVRLMNRSIDLLDDWARESGNRFNLNRRGYLFATAEAERAGQFVAAGEEAASLGAGRLRRHGPSSEEAAYAPAPSSGFEGQPDGSDLITDPDLIRRHFPYLAPDTLAVIHPRRCGWFSAQQLGAFLLERARASGVEVLPGRMAAVRTAGGRVRGVRVDGSGGSHEVETGRLVLAAGPLLQSVAAMLDLELPVTAEWHVKVAMADPLRVVPRDAPLLIWTDPQLLAWTSDERRELAESESTRRLLEPFPAGVHARPEGPDDSPILLILWTYHTETREPVYPGPVDPMYPEVALRGLARMLPGLRAYFGRAPRPVVDGGYYLKTRENRPLIGPLPVQGAFVLGALSGYGLMASAAAGEILAAHVVGDEAPSYARAFRLERYEDPTYQALLEDWGTTGQL
ncbi:MAG TPA: FAD-dependent oxidoreductase [Anaerolineales bacterium]|nr:FAD-dependent oxidoreductase [Anaerolineales bacterium]